MSADDIINNLGWDFVGSSGATIDENLTLRQRIDGVGEDVLNDIQKQLESVKTIKNPVVNNETVEGLFRVVSIVIQDVTRGNKALVRTITRGYAKTLVVKEARLEELAVNSDGETFKVVRRWENLDPKYLDAMAATLEGQLYATLRVQNNDFTDLQSVQVRASRVGDRSGQIVQVLVGDVTAPYSVGDPVVVDFNAALWTTVSRPNEIDESRNYTFMALSETTADTLYVILQAQSETALSGFKMTQCARQRRGDGYYTVTPRYVKIQLEPDADNLPSTFVDSSLRQSKDSEFLFVRVFPNVVPFAGDNKMDANHAKWWASATKTGLGAGTYKAVSVNPQGQEVGVIDVAVTYFKPAGSDGNYEVVRESSVIQRDTIRSSAQGFSITAYYNREVRRIVSRKVVATKTLTAPDIASDTGLGIVHEVGNAQVGFDKKTYRSFSGPYGIIYVEEIHDSCADAWEFKDYAIVENKGGSITVANSYIIVNGELTAPIIP